MAHNRARCALRALVLVAATTCVAAGCASGTSSSHVAHRIVPPSSSTPGTPLPPGTHTLPDKEGTALPAGRFTKTDFQPQPVFELDTGWRVGHDIAGFFDVQQRSNTPDVIAVQFANVYGADTSADAVQQLHDTDGLRVTDRGRTTVGGLPATEVQIDSRNPQLTPAKYTAIFSVSAGSLYIGSGRRLVVDFVQRPGAVVAVLVGGSVRNWPATIRATQPVMRSIRFL